MSSEYEILKTKCDRLEQELAFVKTQWKQTSDLLEQERNRLTAELADVRKERDELLAKGKGNVFVHRHHYDQALAQAAALAGALEDADFILEGSRAIEGQSDVLLERRENALMRFFETLAKYREFLKGRE